MWIPPVTMHSPTRESEGNYGAVRLRDGKLFHLREEEAFAGDSFFIFSKQLRQTSSHAKRSVTLILDNVPSHHASLHKPRRQKWSQKFALEFIAPIQPRTKQHRAPLEAHETEGQPHNPYFSRLPFLMLAVERLFQQWADPKETPRR